MPSTQGDGEWQNVEEAGPLEPREHKYVSPGMKIIIRQLADACAFHKFFDTSRSRKYPRSSRQTQRFHIKYFHSHCRFQSFIGLIHLQLNLVLHVGDAATVVIER